MKAAMIGLDIAKQVFQVHGADKSGKVMFRRKLRRSEVARFFAELDLCLIGMEASGSAHYWARVLSASGHTVKLMAPQFGRPYGKSNKNDANDAEAICEAVTRPNMRLVPQKSVHQQDLQCQHRVRSRLVALSHRRHCDPIARSPAYQAQRRAAPPRSPWFESDRRNPHSRSGLG